MVSGQSSERRRRVLFFAEAVTLAHVARPIALARQLDPSRFDVTVACDTRYAKFLAPESFRAEPLAGIGSREFKRRLSRGSPVYTVDELRAYVRDDLALIERVKPDLIVGDFRLSLSVSARLAKRPYATVTNAYWSPFAEDQRLPVPVLPLTRWLPIPVAQTVFDWAQPIAMRTHCAPLNQIRLDNGLPSLGHDLRRTYTDADQVLYADAPALFAMRALPRHHNFLGPLAWAPRGECSIDWSALDAHRPTVYLALGSSGDPRVLATAVNALEALTINLVVSSAGAVLTGVRMDHVQIAAYVDGAEAARRSTLVVCNGGSMGCQQALTAGVPVIGVVGNMDQFLNMTAIETAGVGQMLRADRMSAGRLRRVAERMLLDAPMREAVRRRAIEPANGITSFQAFAQQVASG